MRLLQEDDLRWVAGGLCKHGLYTSSEYWDIESNYYAAESAYNCAVTVLFDLDPNDPAQAAAYAAAEAQYESASDWYSSASNDYGYMEVCTDPLCDAGGGWGGQAPGQSSYWNGGVTGSSGGSGGSGGSTGGTGVGDSGNWFIDALSSVADFLGFDGSVGYDGEEGREWLWQPAMDYLQDRWDALGSAVQAGWHVIQEFANFIWDEIVGVVQSLIDGDLFRGLYGGGDTASIPPPPPPPPLPGGGYTTHPPVTTSAAGMNFAQNSGRVTIDAGVTADPTRVAAVKGQLESRIAENYDRVHGLADNGIYEVELGVMYTGAEIKAMFDKQKWVFQPKPVGQADGYAGANVLDATTKEYTVNINWEAINDYALSGPAALDYLIFHEMGHVTDAGRNYSNQQYQAWLATGELHLDTAQNKWVGGQFDDSTPLTDGTTAYDIPFENQERYANQLSWGFQDVVGITTQNQFTPQHGY